MVKPRGIYKDVENIKQIKMLSFIRNTEITLSTAQFSIFTMIKIICKLKRMKNYPFCIEISRVKHLSVMVVSRGFKCNSR